MYYQRMTKINPFLLRQIITFGKRQWCRMIRSLSHIIMKISVLPPCSFVIAVLAYSNTRFSSMTHFEERITLQAGNPQTGTAAKEEMRHYWTQKNSSPKTRHQAAYAGGLVLGLYDK
eukprot:TRINITY_DN38_c0_g1_i2.p1 TRINITY_DN38_c0_g1~~TRINITY_DN38_c0_g1_i2.p1  ORF type:complete len:117 (-),score=17.25 TRINITY_DN38_c0_g1_i2:304-654(-)